MIYGRYLYHCRHEGKLHAQEDYPEEGKSKLLRNGTFLQGSTSSSPQPVCRLSSVTAVHTEYSVSLDSTDHPTDCWFLSQISVPYAPLEKQMSLLYRSAHTPTFGDCCLFTDSVYWFRMILRMSSDIFLTVLKDWSV